MLARRFTIVCLLMSLFGMLFAVLVAEAGRPAHAWDRHFLPARLPEPASPLNSTTRY
ncbi:hypothetical protein NMG46_23895 [Mesorhizobium sp. LMG 17147]|uniref:hypothetical protein n=1 Tax=Mesorhizobium sp. LMG 17147 TaxID=2963091 RepID=UPI0020C9F5D6|nr:hypothetical protein [Mesorhizobium sp. LMG 17147]MCP9233248.1 hypothetical protein [Mesorhizobium sp. LMG 17147]